MRWLLGKFLGICGSTWLICKLRFGALPRGMQFGHVIGIALLAGIGFTMSLFISESAFCDCQDILAAKVGIFLASTLACLTAAVYFFWYTRKLNCYVNLTQP